MVFLLKQKIIATLAMLNRSAIYFNNRSNSNLKRTSASKTWGRQLVVINRESHIPAVAGNV